MSIKHVIKEYNRINDSFMEMIDTLHEMEEMASQNIVSPEMLEQTKKMVEPMKNNKARWDYMMFLLRLPNKESKKKRYEQLNMETIEKLNEIKAQEDKENDQSKDNLRQLVKSIDN